MRPRRNALDDEREIALRKSFTTDIIYVPAGSSPRQRPASDQATVFQALAQNFATQNVPATRDTLNWLARIATYETVKMQPLLLELNIFQILCELLAVDVPDITSSLIRFIEKVAENGEENADFIDQLVRKGFGLICLSKLSRTNLRYVPCLSLLAKVSDAIVHEIIRSEFFTKIVTFFGTDSDRDLVVLLTTLSSCVLDTIEEKKLLSVVKEILRDKAKIALWDKVLSVPRKRIVDLESSRRVLLENGFLTMANEFLLEKRVNVVVNSLHLLGMHFLHSSDFVDINYPKIVALTKSSHDSVVTASLWLISNCILSHYPIIHKLVEYGLIVGLKHALCDCNIKAKYEALSVMSLMVLGGSLEERKLMVSAGFVTGLTGLLEISEIQFVKVIAETLHPLLSLPDAREQFENACGMELLEDLLASNDRDVYEQAIAIKDTIESM